MSGVKKVILNLRDSRGGIFDNFLLSCFPFINGNDTLAVGVNRKTKVVFDSTYIANHLKGKNPGRFRDFKIVCLVNGNTGSASEFFSKTLQRWGYVLIGEPTFGMSTKLRRCNLSDGSMMLVAIDKMYFGGKQEEIPETGVVPNFIVKNDEGLGIDLQLEKAIEILQKGDKK
jgi:C-terminal processing protease CtpA/Prc